MNRKKISLLLALIIVMCGAFLGYDKQFQMDSETLVTGPLRGNEEWIKIGEYPLGRYQGVDGIMTDYSSNDISKEWRYGFAPDESAFIIFNNTYTRELVDKVAKIKDKKGHEYTVEGYIIAGDYIRINLLDGTVLNKENNGAITDFQYYDKNDSRLFVGIVSDYKSQIGLQGMVFKKIAPKTISYITARNIARGCCIVLLATVLVLISYFIGLKYDWLLATAFYITFCTSPWIINFSPNLYWVEFTWFIPMLIGLAIIMTNMCFRYRLLAYGSALLAIALKCMCGYEYISTILIGMVMFPIVEFVTNWRKGNKIRAKLCIRLIMGLGCMGVVGFIFALTIHGYMRGDGDVLIGLQNIYQQDVLRRTWGGDITKFSSVYADSFSASVFVVLAKYLFFKTNVVMGIPGSLFALFGISPLLIKWYYTKKSINLPWENETWVIYCVGLVATLSWLVLAKSHSYIHTHINFVLWYFGFVQICMYCLLVALRTEIVNLLIKNNVLSDEWRERLS